MEISERNRIRNNLISALRQYSETLERIFGKTTLILFGSFARGDFNLWSDVDIIIISDVFKNVRFLDRAYNLPELPEELYYSDIICWSYDESKKMFLKHNWKEALRASVVIVDEYNIF